jgi:hypothetical protein
MYDQSMAGLGVRGVYPSSGEVKAIAAIDGPVGRNLRITECYARLSAAMRAQIGEGANWCTFATWASRQAGCTIRGEDLGDRLGDLARGGFTIRHPIRSLWRVLLRRGLFDPHTLLGRVVRAIHSPFDAFEIASDAVAAGNRKVFEEIGYQTARYLEMCRATPAPDAPEFAAFLSGVEPDLLRRAFQHYQQQRTEARPQRRAQLMLLANLEIGFHEQTRLQPEIERALNAAPLPDGWLARPYRRFALELTRHAVSEVLMVLRIPGAVLSLGSNLPYPVPPVFAAPDEPELVAMMKSVDPSACVDCGAEDWSDVRQRMHYIFHLFRALHETADLFDPPFSAEQVNEIWSGRIPPGTL